MIFCDNLRLWFSKEGSNVSFMPAIPLKKKWSKIVEKR